MARSQSALGSPNEPSGTPPSEASPDQKLLPRRNICCRRRSRTHELFRALHSAPDRDHPAHGRGGAVGIAAFRVLPVSPLPQVDFPTVSVSASLPGASPEIMASSVATPLERGVRPDFCE